MANKELINSPAAVSLALVLARLFPPWAGYWVGDRLGLLVSRQRSLAKVQAVRANQWVVAGGALSATELERRTQVAFRATGRCLYDFYHNFHDPIAMERLVVFSPSFRRTLEWSQREVAQFLLVPHCSNFDLVGRAAVLSGLRMQVLSYAQPPAGYRMQNVLRSVKGLDITPISVESLRKALGNLRNGGTVLTGVDRPMEGVSQPMADRPLFFGRQANLPTGYVRLAMNAGAPMVVISGKTLPDGRYLLWASDPLQPPRKNGRDDEVKSSAEAVLEIVAQLIGEAPEQWSMFYPVWPEALLEVPS